MKALPVALPAVAYFDEDWFEKEKTLLFKRTWQFFTFYSLVNELNRFVTKTLFGIPIVVQNCDGELRAFENICLHRNAPIQTETFGRRPLSCQYHGWSYRADGSVAVIPGEEDYYRFPSETVASLCLKRFPVARIGNLVFISLCENPIPLEHQFTSAFLDSLRAVSACLDDNILATTFHRRFNWKLIFENLRDALHPLYLHRNTFYRNVKSRPRAVSQETLVTYLQRQNGTEQQQDPLVEIRSFSRGGADGRIEKLAPRPWHRNVERYGDQDWFYNWLVFPNLHIVSMTGGYSFIAEHYVPTSPSSTDVHVYYTTARRKKPYTWSTAILYQHLVAAERLFQEDFGMLELIQNGFHGGSPHQNWGAFELRSHQVSNWISRLVNGRISI